SSLDVSWQGGKSQPAGTHAAVLGLPCTTPPCCQQLLGTITGKGLGCQDGRAGRGEGPSRGCWREFSSRGERPGKTGSF
ncbi:unnamed protein product, partial [Bubo scandiacus]